MQTVTLARDPLDFASWVTVEVEDVREYLKKELGTWPSTARIYAENVSEENDVTPRSEADVEKLPFYERLYVVLYPEGPVAIIAAVVGVIALAAAAFLLTPKTPTPTIRNTSQSSPNNELSERENRPRPNGRIPDIYGTVRATPDLLSSYKVFESHRELEIAYMCVGRGEYEIEDVRDGDTPLSAIAGASAEFYGPETSPNSGAAFLTIGSSIDDPVLTARRLNEVNGQVLAPEEAADFIGRQDVRMVSPNLIQTSNLAADFSELFPPASTLTVIDGEVTGTVGSALVNVSAAGYADPDGTLHFLGYDPSADFSIGDRLLLSNVVFEAFVEVVAYADDLRFEWPNIIRRRGSMTEFSVNAELTVTGTYSTLDFAGTYTISRVRDSVLELYQPSDVNGDWSVLSTLPNDRTPYVSGSISAPSDGRRLSLDLNGIYEITAVDSTSITLDGTDSGDWASIAAFPGGSTPPRTLRLRAYSDYEDLDLSGDYTVSSSTASEVVLSSPEGVNADWSSLEDLSGDATPFFSPRLRVDSPTWIGPFVVDDPDMEFLLVNLVALNGLYKDDGRQRYAANVEIEFGVTPIDQNFDPTGPEEYFQVTVEGTSTNTDTRAATGRLEPSFGGRCQIRARRITPKDTTFQGQVMDEVKWRDCYSMTPVPQDHFGNVTTVHSRTYATDGALALKERKLNCLATRKLPEYEGEGVFGDLVATRSAADIICALCLDPHVGARSSAEVDFDQIYATIDEVVSYFGSEEAAEFCYTFDSDNLSFEETLATVADAVFCTAYRQGSVIRLRFEKRTDDSILLFNHRNKLPGSETRTVRFGNVDEYDGVELEWVDPLDDSVVTFYIPEDKSAVNPKTIESVGIRNFAQASWQAWRAWRKILHQNLTSEFDATAEAAIVISRDRVLVADNTRPDTMDGEVVAQEGLEITLSQPVVLDPEEDYWIFLQNPDGSVYSRAITAGSDDRKVVFGSAPASTLVLEREKFVRTTYTIVRADDPRRDAMLISEVSPKDAFTHSVKAVNYDSRYYLHDQLGLWLPFRGSYDDFSAWRRSGETSGSAIGFAEDSERGEVLEIGGSVSHYVLDGTWGTGSYTKAAWVKRITSSVSNVEIFSVTSGSQENFRLIASGFFSIAHNGTGLSSAWTPSLDVWHHYVAAYEASTGQMKMYIDGELIRDATAAARVDSQLAVGNVRCRISDLMYFSRALDDREVLALYLEQV